MPYRRTLLMSAAVVIFVSSAAFSALTAYDRQSALATLPPIIVGAIIYAALAYGLRTFAQARWLVMGLCLIGLIFALFFIGHFDHLGRQYADDYGETPKLINSLGSLTTIWTDAPLGRLQPNTAATVLEGIIPLLLALAWRPRWKWERGVWLLAFGICLYAILLTYSRGAWLGLGVVGLIVAANLALRRLPRQVAWASIGALGIGFVVLMAVLIVRGPAKVESLALLQTTNGNRLSLYVNNAYLGRDYLFSGIGLGDSYALVYSRYGLLIQSPFLWYPHNLFLSAWLAQGFLGVLALLGVCVNVYRLVFAAVRRGSPTALFHGAWLGLTVIWLHGLTDARQYIEPNALMPEFFIHIGLVAGLAMLTLVEPTPLAVSVKEPHPLSESPQMAGEESQNRIPPLQGARGLGGEVGRRGAAVLAREVLRILTPAGAALLVVILLTLVVMRGTLLAAWRTNQGALAETVGALTPDLSDAQRAAYQDHAKNYYDQALLADAAYAPAQRRLGNLLWSRGAYGEAVVLLQSAAAQEPYNPAAVKGLGLAYVWAGDVPAAIATLSRMADLHEMRQELNDWANWRSSPERNEMRLAAFAREVGQSLLPEAQESAVWVMIGDEYAAARDILNARRAYTQALALDPNNALAQQKLG